MDYFNNTPNLRPLHPSRKRVRPGDVFLMSPAEGLFIAGRVIRDDAVVTAFEGCLLVYVFDHRLTSEEAPPAEALTTDHLLVPPFMINRLPWSRGYFWTVRNEPIGPGQEVARHCFRDLMRDRYWDEYSNPVSGPCEHVGVHALASYRTTDDRVCEALGIPLAP
jgi:hypothetical protein